MHCVIASAKFPSGVTYPLNILLELGINVWRQGPHVFWHPTEDGGYSLDPTQHELIRFLPSVDLDRTYYFSNRVNLEWTHEWPSEAMTSGPVICFIRNGKDAIFSDYKRQLLDVPFLDYLRLPLKSAADSVHLIHHQWLLPPPEIWALYNLLWSDLCQDNNGVILRYEDIKRSPLQEMEKLLTFLGEPRNVSDIEQAIRRSSFEMAREAEKRYLTMFPNADQRLYNRKGTPGESGEVFGESHHKCFEGLPDYALHLLGYNDSYTKSSSTVGEATFCDSLLTEMSFDGIVRKALQAAAINSTDIFQAGLAVGACRWIRDIAPKDPFRCLYKTLTLIRHFAFKPALAAASALNLIGINDLGARTLMDAAMASDTLTEGENRYLREVYLKIPRKTMLTVEASPMDNDFTQQLRNKWQEIPATRQDRAFSSDLLDWPDDRLLEYWDECRQQTTTPNVRGWFQGLYRDDFTGLEIADVGPGVGVDGIYFAQRGAHVTFVDIVEDNLRLLKRICTLKGISADYYFIDDFFSYRFTKQFDAFLFIGSMINAPFDFTQRQLEAMLTFLRPGGKVLMLGYPKERYIRLGAQSCEEFGKMTDGERTPWCEWYNDEKVRMLFGPGYQLNWSRNFGSENLEFNWFDLTKLPAELPADAARPENAYYVEEYGIHVPMVHVYDLDKALTFETPLDYPKSSLAKRFSQWKMETDDAPIFRYIYRNASPRRHLEFGTWLGRGTVFCLEECGATVWTINRPFGGAGNYGFYPEELPDAHAWAARIGMQVSADGYSSDSIGFIGKSYLERNLGRRVCQVYCDSLEWDTSNIPEGFFDTVLIDGGHDRDVVISDTRKALPLLRPGGIIMWHDFCPSEYTRFESTRGVMSAVAEEWGLLNRQTSRLFWVYPSMILVGIKK